MFHKELNERNGGFKGAWSFYFSTFILFYVQHLLYSLYCLCYYPYIKAYVYVIVYLYVYSVGERKKQGAEANKNEFFFMTLLCNQ